MVALLGLHDERVDSGTLDRAATRAAEERAVAESWLPREGELAVARERASELAAEAEELSSHLATARAELAPSSRAVAR